MNKEQLKQQVCAAIEAKKDAIIGLGDSIFNEPELGFKEFKTADKVKQIFSQMNLSYQDEMGITGVKARIKGKQPTTTIAVMGELDAIVCHEHPNSDKTTGAAHCCGHNVQVAAMVAVGMGLIDANAMQYLAGDVVLFAVPAEEYAEITYRNELRSTGKLSWISGKSELIASGAFDDVDMAMQIHVMPDNDHQGFMGLSDTSNGFIGKLINYKGKAAHAAAGPHEGINALNAALMGLNGVNAIRDTFRDEDHVRFHPIITKGGDLVNVVPSDVRLESYVRAATVQSMINANNKINRALKAGAMALGAEVEIIDLPGMLPLNNNKEMNNFFAQNAGTLVGKDRISSIPHIAGSTDAGDLSQMIPLIHPWIGGIEGTLHGADYKIYDKDLAYIKSAQAMAMTIIDLLFDDAAGAQKVRDNFKPILTKQSYLELLNSLLN